MKTARDICFYLSMIIITSLLSGCASIVDGTSQSVSVDTPPVTGATCTLSNDKGKWYINSTPGSVMLHQSLQDLAIHCEKAGYPFASQKVKSTVKPMFFGNIIFGGVIGVIVDTVDGAGFDYPTNIHVPMPPQ